MRFGNIVSHVLILQSRLRRSWESRVCPVTSASHRSESKTTPTSTHIRDHRLTKHYTPDRHRHVDGFAILNNMILYGCPSLSIVCSYTIWPLTDSAMVHLCVVS